MTILGLLVIITALSLFLFTIGVDKCRVLQKIPAIERATGHKTCFLQWPLLSDAGLSIATSQNQSCRARPAYLNVAFPSAASRYYVSLIPAGAQYNFSGELAAAAKKHNCSMASLTAYAVNGSILKSADGDDTYWDHIKTTSLQGQLLPSVSRNDSTIVILRLYCPGTQTCGGNRLAENDLDPSDFIRVRSMNGQRACVNISVDAKHMARKSNILTSFYQFAYSTKNNGLRTIESAAQFVHRSTTNETFLFANPTSYYAVASLIDTNYSGMIVQGQPSTIDSIVYRDFIAINADTGETDDGVPVDPIVSNKPISNYTVLVLREKCRLKRFDTLPEIQFTLYWSSETKNRALIFRILDKSCSEGNCSAIMLTKSRDLNSTETANVLGRDTPQITYLNASLVACDELSSASNAKETTLLEL